MPTIEQIYQQHINPIPIDEQLRLIVLITQKLVKSKANIWQALQEFHNPTDKKPLLKECQVFEENRNNWRDNMSEKVKILVSEDELIQPMTDIWEDYI
jgi:hypothetical protein